MFVVKLEGSPRPRHSSSESLGSILFSTYIDMNTRIMHRKIYVICALHYCVLAIMFSTCIEMSTYITHRNEYT